jgi:hypothetical protein
MKLQTRLSLLVLLTTLSSVVAAQIFELSEKTREISWPTHDWNGRHAFPPVYCLTFPSPTDALRMTTAMFNRNSISFTRVIYKNDTALFVVTSTIPRGRTPEDEVAKILEDNRRHALASPENIQVEDLSSSFGRTNGLKIRNPTEGDPKTPFPLARGIALFPDGTLRSLSVHRLFARGPDRFEVAALRFFRTPIPSADDKQETENLVALVNTTTEALHKCTVQLPI